MVCNSLIIVGFRIGDKKSKTVRSVNFKWGGSNQHPNTNDIWIPFLQTYHFHEKYYNPKQQNTTSLLKDKSAFYKTYAEESYRM